MCDIKPETILDLRRHRNVRGYRYVGEIAISEAPSPVLAPWNLLVTRLTCRTFFGSSPRYSGFEYHFWQAR